MTKLPTLGGREEKKYTDTIPARRVKLKCGVVHISQID